MNPLDTMLAQHLISNTVTGYMVAVDRREWDLVGTFFADEVMVDYTSVRPLPPAQLMHRETMVGMWQERYLAVASYQHQLSNIVVSLDGDTASCSANNVATHVRIDSKLGYTVLWQIGVRLHWQLIRSASRWLISGVRAEHLWERSEPYAAMQ